MSWRCRTSFGNYDGRIFFRYQDAREWADKLNDRDHITSTGGDYWYPEEIKEENHSDSHSNDEELRRLQEKTKELDGLISELKEQKNAQSSDNSSAVVVAIVAGLFSVVGVILGWLLSTKTGRQIMMFLCLLGAGAYGMYLWENRAYVETTYYSDGHVKSEQAYKSRKLNGVSKMYAPNGQLEKEQTYLDNELHGVAIEYYANGQPKSRQNYKLGKLDGVSSFYLESGVLEKEQTYKNNVKNGVSKIYYPNGQLKSEAIMTNNKLNGMSVLYDEKGKILRKEKFVNGKATNIIE